MALKRDTEVLVVGGGPVGMLAALSLAERGVKVEIIDKQWRSATRSYALALHPGALSLLDPYGLVAHLVKDGHRVEAVSFYDGHEQVGRIDVSRLEGAFPFVLVVGQSSLEAALMERLREAKVKIHWNHQAFDMRQEAVRVITKVGRMEKYSMGYPVAHTEWMIGKEFEVSTGMVIGADGYHSFVRKSIEAGFDEQGQAGSFQVFECPSTTAMGSEMRVVFCEGTTNVLWPMRGDRGRWSFQIDPENPPERDLDTLRRFIRERAPWFGGGVDEVHWSTSVMFEQRMTDRFGRDRAWLVGDAAHITGPVGVQSMNVGLHEAQDLAERVSAVLKAGAPLASLDHYQSERQKEWKALLGVEPGIHATAGAPDWSKKHAAAILPCIPASGADLEVLMAQIGLEFELKQRSPEG